MDFKNLASKVVNSDFHSEGTLSEQFEHFMKTHVNIFDEFINYSFIPHSKPVVLSSFTKKLLKDREEILF